MLKSAAILLAAMTLLYLPYGLASAQGPVQEALEGCSKELKTYCSAVTPGGGRLVSCAKAHEDKLSSECVHAIIRADRRPSDSQNECTPDIPGELNSPAYKGWRKSGPSSRHPKDADATHGK